MCDCFLITFARQQPELKPLAIKISSVTARHVALTLNPESDFMDAVCPVLEDVSADSDLYIYI